MAGLKNDLLAVQHRFKGTVPFPDFSHSFSQLRNVSSNATNAELSAAEDVVSDALDEVFTWIFQNFGITIPKKEVDHATTGAEKFLAILEIFFTVFLYFFIAAGCTRKHVLTPYPFSCCWLLPDPLAHISTILTFRVRLHS